MATSFEEYIRQLRELEQSDNKAALHSFISLNEPVLSYFKGIWEPLQSILQSSNVDTGIIKELKPILVHLSEIKDAYNSLRVNSSRECRDEINQFQKQIDSITIPTYAAVLSKLQLLESKNRSALQREKSGGNDSDYWLKNKDRILSGQFSTTKDFSLAETHISEGRSLAFFNSLVTHSQKASSLNNVYVAAKNILQGGQLVDLLWSLVRSSISFGKKDDAILDLIYRADSSESLSRIESYCTSDRTLSAFKSKKSALDTKGGSSKGCLVAFIIAAIVATIVFFAVFV